MVYDVLVIGGGPGGLSAAINVRARNKSVAVVTNPLEENPLWKSELVDNHLGMPGRSGASMLQQMRSHAKESGVEIILGKALTTFFNAGRWYVSVGSSMYEAGAVVLATGISRGKKFPGEEALVGRGVSYCATCDAMLYRNKDVAVIGFTESAKEEAAFLEQVGCRVQLLEKPKSCEIIGEQSVSAVRWDGGEVAVEGVFVLRPTMAPTDLFPGLALDGAYVAVDRSMATNLPGLYAAGDCTGLPLQVSKAVGEGLVAGQAAAAYVAKQGAQAT